MSDAEQMRADRLRTAATNLAVWAMARDILGQLQAAKIPVLVFKSLPQLQDLHGNIGGRLTGDVDVLVPEVHAREAFAIAVSNGWRLHEQALYARMQLRDVEASPVSSRPWHFTQTVGALTAIIDLHSDRMTRVRKPVLDPDVWLRAVPCCRDGVEFLVPAPEDQLLLLCWHFLYEAMNTRQVPSQKLVDIQQALKLSGRIDREYLSLRAHTTGVALSLHLACRMAERNAREPLPSAWRTVRPEARMRAFVLGFLLPMLLRPTTYHLRVLVWPFTNDCVGKWLPSWIEVFVPTRETVALSQPGAEPSAPEYLRYVVRMYRRRARGLLRNT